MHTMRLAQRCVLGTKWRAYVSTFTASSRSGMHMACKRSVVCTLFGSRYAKVIETQCLMRARHKVPLTRQFCKRRGVVSHFGFL